MATKENVLTVLKLADKKLTKEFVKRGAASTTHIARRWQSGLREIATVLRNLYLELGKLELLWVGSDTKKSVSLKVVKNIRKSLCEGKLGGKTLVDIYEIAEQTSKLLKGVGRKSFIFHPTASLNSSESIKILNSWGNQLSSIVWGWKKFAKSTEKISSGVEDLLKKILNTSSMEKIIKYLNLMLSERYIEYWDMFRDTTDEELELDPQGEKCKGASGDLNKYWKFEKIGETGSDAKTRILKILKSSGNSDTEPALKEIVEKDINHVRYSGNFSSLVQNVINHIEGIEVNIDDKKIEGVNDKNTEEEKKLVEFARNIAKSLRKQIEEVNSVVKDMKNAQSDLKAKETELEKAVKAVRIDKPESIISVETAMDNLVDSKEVYSDAFAKFIWGCNSRRESVCGVLQELYAIFCEALQEVPTEVRAKEIAKGIATITKTAPKSKRKADDPVYKIKEAPQYLTALKNGEEGDKLFNKIQTKDNNRFENVEEKSLESLMKYVDGLVRELNAKSSIESNLESLQNVLTTVASNLKGENIKLQSDLKSQITDEAQAYVDAETDYNNKYKAIELKGFEEKFESLNAFKGIYSVIPGGENIIRKFMNGADERIKEVLGGGNAKAEKLNKMQKAAKNAKKIVLGKTTAALEAATKYLEETKKTYQDYNVEPVKSALKTADKAVKDAQKDVKKINDNIIDKDGTAVVGDALKAVAKAVTAVGAAVPPTFEAAQADSGESDDETVGTF